MCDEQRLEHYLDRGIPTDSGCLEWPGALTTCGYPRVGINGNCNVRLTRLIVECKEGHKLQNDEVARHTCDNPICINPDHLVVGTAWDNMNDRDSRDRSATAKLTVADVKEIKETYTKYYGVLQDLSKKYSVSPSTIFAIVHGKTWKWV